MKTAAALAALIGPIACKLLGEPNKRLSKGNELRFGKRGSLAVEIAGEKRGSWYDHENKQGGGVFELLAREKGLDRDGADEWLFNHFGSDFATDSIPDRASKPRIVATYDYCQDGRLLFQVVRFAPKDFRQRRPAGKDWIWNLNGVSRVLHRLSELTVAVDAGNTIYVAEGEKAVDAVVGLGLCATCSPGGAGSWRNEYNSLLAGANVVVLADNDLPGQKHADDVVAALQGVATSVRRLDLPGLPTKGDVADWIGAGGTAATLIELATRAPGIPPEVVSTPTAAIRGFDSSEDGVAQAFTERHQHDLRYCHHARSWFAWTGSYWRRDESGSVFHLVRETCRRIAAPVEDKDRRRIGRAAFCGAVEKFAQSDRMFAVISDQWDRDPWVLGTPEGTVDLRTGALHAADRDDFITKRAAISPASPGTPHPEWTAFLAAATGGDEDFQAFLQRLAGYCLTGDVTEEVLAFLYGQGGTGKGTFLGTIGAIMADYAISVPIEVFTSGARSPVEYYRAQMAGARLVTASETEANSMWAESQIKEMSGNEAPLSGRDPYGKPFNFKPQFKIILVGNYSPRLKGRSEAMERRLRIAPFEHRPSVADSGLKQRLWGERAAIFRWCIDGCLAWQRDRLGTCAVVEKATHAYFERQDHLGRWLEERCILDKGLSLAPGVLLADYNHWAKSSGEDTLSANEFAERVDVVPGLYRQKSNGVRVVRGIGLKSQIPSDHCSRDG